jgi:Ca2+-binding EF-hand superfamily protein
MKEELVATAEWTSQDFEFYREAFSAIDTNGDGYLDAEELKQLFTNSTQSSLSNSIIVLALKNADRNDDGLVDFYVSL